jgi:2-methylisocitrate lyase-like PEP mutase family enzyme
VLKTAEENGGPDFVVKAFDGRLNVSLKMVEGNLTAKELAKVGVSRISVGPAIQFMAMDAFGKEAEKFVGECVTSLFEL